MLTGNPSKTAVQYTVQIMHGYNYCRTPFGREYETTGATRFTIPQKVEDVHNHFMIVTGDYLEDLLKQDSEKATSQQQ